MQEARAVEAHTMNTRVEFGSVQPNEDSLASRPALAMTSATAIARAVVESGRDSNSHRYAAVGRYAASWTQIHAAAEPPDP